MRGRVAILITVAACTFDGGGLGAAPQSGGGGETTTMSGPVGEAPTTTGAATDAGSGTGSTGDGGPGGDPTSMPAMTTDLDATTGAEATTEAPCPTAMLYYDGDGDGFGDPNTGAVVCVGTPRWVADNTDCNDMAAYAHPGFEERCDTIDNDCDGAIDEYHPVHNPTGCMDCAFQVYGGHLYYFCAKGMSWDAAEAFCVLHGLHLAKDDAGGEHEWLLQNIGDSGLWWLGGHDKAENSKFRWVADDSPVPHPGHWALGQPDDAESLPFDGADCLLLVDANGDGWVYAGGQWYDGECSEARRFICEGPVP